MGDAPLILRMAWRELRGGFAGFRIFFLCLMLGAAAISGVQSVSAAFLASLSDQGQTLLGGDVAVSLVHRPATTDELDFLARRGTVSRTVSMRAMAFAPNGGRNLVELKAADGRWPLFGAPGLVPAQSLRDAIYCEEDGVCGAAAEQTLLDKLHLKRGDLFRIGDETFRVMAALASEPDRVSTGFSLGPHVLVSDKALAPTHLVTPESLVDYNYHVALRPGVTIAGFRADAARIMADSGWRIEDRTDAAPGIRRFVEQMAMFLTLVGLSALGAGGVGASQAIIAFLDRKRAHIAILKSLGARGGLVFSIFFTQVMTVALAAAVTGAALGAIAPYAVAYLYGAALPVPPHLGFYPVPAALAVAFGLLAAIVFSVPQLARTRAIPPAALLRDGVAPQARVWSGAALAVAGIAALLVTALTLWLAPSPLFAAEFLGGAVAALILLRLMAEGLRRALKKLPPPRSPVMRLALANLARPGAATTGVVTALGLGLTLLAIVTLLSATIAAQVNQALPAQAPSFFFVDIQPADAPAFDRMIASFKTASAYQRTPMIRGRIVALNGVPAADAKVASDAKWALSGDRGITYAATPPPGTRITAGHWWAPDYRGPTLISLDESVARGTGLGLGDTLRLNVLGREFDGRIASLRKVDFTNGQQNFVLILSPGLIDKAPHAFLATVRVPDADESRMYRVVTDKFPGVSTIRVKEAIAQVNGFLAELGKGVSAASLITILAGLLVLAGAIAAGARAHIYDATILKVLGATRPRIALVYAIEYGLLGLGTGAVALAAGVLGAFAIAWGVLDVPLVVPLRALLVTVLGGGAVTLALGLVSALAALRSRPARLLRAP